MAKKVEFNIELVKKLSFWVLVPLVLLLAFIFNLLAVSSLGKKFNERKKSLEGTKSSVEKIRQDKAHPNNNTIDDIKVHIEELRGRFVTAWATLEKEQRIRNVWPVDLGIPFIEEVSKLKFGDHISAASLELYLNFMNKCIPKLEAKLNRKRIQVNEGGVWKDKEGIGADTIRNIGRSNRSDSLANNNLEREEGIVEWPSPEIRNIMSSWALQPTSIEVWYAQEEFWVYDSLISLIEKSNSGASSTHSAVIKRIESMLIGQQASHELASRLSVQTMGGEGEGGMPSGSGARPAPPPSPPRAPGPGRLPVGEGMTGSDEESIGKSKRHERYVDANNVPLSADAASPFGEFNRMPICLRLIVDRQRIPDILVNCANSAMPIDVLSVRINPGAGGDANSRLGNTNQPSRPSGGRSGNIGGGGGGGIDIGKQITMDGSSGLDSIYGPNAVPIEIYGCINIFNPVDQDIAQKAGKPTP